MSGYFFIYIINVSSILVGVNSFIFSMTIKSTKMHRDLEIIVGDLKI